ncbi:PLP-dependent aminotransferase family protein [Defluviimonas sp. D31]|uniref:MocR-like pyridoxine biosynthesis transcription factor PdxR n=1 Tax=Defluviimonas sp. D31 TaxID=3083253 RepID=UPI00296E7EFA|nr:PLP-dependent aminotransferase family protein [Defluviimonas sp. D31]MDW4550977.1 PLP-dependent aminotransferase family protein [Defluviimonas sp. D31]
MEPLVLSALSKPDRNAETPLAVQLYRDLLEAIRSGRARGRLPSSRVAAAALGLSRNTVNAAYELLRAEGAVAIRPGAAPEILPPAAAAPAPTEVEASPGPGRRGQAWAAGRSRSGGGIMAPGHPDEALFPRDDWAMHLRRAARRRLGRAFAYGEYSGLPALREVLARRLAADRGMQVTPDQILITPGSQASLALIALTLADPGDTALIEEPGYPGARAAFRGAGLTTLPLTVDAEGADVSAAARARLTYLTPANQYPMGHRLSLRRRAEALDHARASDGFLVEDDYDSEFHWHGREIAALQGMAPERVIALGTAAKALMPALRIGWIVAPSGLAGPLRAAQRNLGLAANVHAQAALAEFMETGRYRAHLRRIAKVYGERGRALAAALRSLPGIDVADPSGGVQIGFRLPESREAAALTALHSAGFGTAALSDYCLGRPQEGLITGFAEATPERIAHFTATLRRVLPTR